MLSQREVDDQINLLLTEVVSDTLELYLSAATTTNIRSDFTPVATAVTKWPFYCLDLGREGGEGGGGGEEEEKRGIG